MYDIRFSETDFSEEQKYDATFSQVGFTGEKLNSHISKTFCYVLYIFYSITLICQIIDLILFIYIFIIQNVQESPPLHH